MEMMNYESPKKVTTGNDTDDSTASDLSGGTRGSCSPPPKRPRPDDLKPLTSTTTADDDDNKTSSARSSISEELDGPLQSQPPDPLQAVVLRYACTEEVARIILAEEEFYASKPSSEEYKEHMRSMEKSWRSKHSPPEIDTDVGGFDKLHTYARLALKYYKELTGDDFQYEGPRSMCVYSLPGSDYKGTHLNFFARLRIAAAPELLFFADLEHGPVRKVTECCILSLPKYGAVDFLTHPPHVKCSECTKSGDAVLCFEEEEPMWCDM